MSTGRCVCKFALLLLFLTALASLLFWLIFLPREVKFHVTEASLTQFDFTTANNTLNFNLTLKINLRNSNQRVGVFYERIDAIAYYNKKKWFCTVGLTPFYQGHKNSSILRPVFQGHQFLLLGARDLSKLDSEKSSGIYSITINLSVQIRVRYGKIKTISYEPRKIKCSLKVPLITNGTTAQEFMLTECNQVNFF
ncbi:hypothetical protein F2P56_015622 [Juglans regia]|uniref:NDR1/HIN1-like protein 10 n=2 Tax=Juglans regia TaxID=51240 RepID=A0A2I4GSM7_JUGRE|nr:NDR1/HIN1-like protein 10 [Juglans regia]KAF5465639.1 hypothetical protein F2P56_015622 [Juglans regia]